MIILDRLKKSWENDCPEKICSCGNCQGNNNNEPEFMLKENLSDEEIEEIIEREYKDRCKTDKDNIRRALKRFGNKYSYHKTEFRYRRGEQTSRATVKLITVTCAEHGDFTIKRSEFFKIGCPDCFLEESNSKIVDDVFKKLFI